MTQDQPAAARPMVPVRCAGLAVSPWRNGAGRKADIASAPGWLVGYAWLDGDAPFSDYTGYDRTITLLEGPGFTLDFADRPPVVVTTIHRPTLFDGSAAAFCRVRGPSRVLNVMTSRDRYRHDLTLLDGPGKRSLDPAGTEALLAVVLHGTATVAAGPQRVLLGPGDALRLPHPATVQTAPGASLCIAAITP